MPAIEIVVDDETRVLPARKVVCPRCEGEGTVLRPGIAGHAYTLEEFHEEFDEEERGEYFRRGGRYDVHCPECNGLRVVDEVDESKLSAADKAFYEEWLEEQDARDEYERVCAAERRMGA